jgi:uncharacterized protein DUF6150
MRFACLILAVLFCSNPTQIHAASVYQTDFAAEARAKIFVTQSRSEANCIVYRTDFEGQADAPGIWYFTRFRGAGVPIYVTAFRGEADLIVYFTDFPGEAACAL